MNSSNQEFTKNLTTWTKHHLKEGFSPVTFVEMSLDSEQFQLIIESTKSFNEIEISASLLKQPFLLKDSDDNSLNENNYHLLDCLVNNVARVQGPFYNVLENSIWLNSFYNKFKSLRSECLFIGKTVAQDFNNRYKGGINQKKDSQKVESALLKNIEAKSFSDLKKWKENRMTLAGFKSGEKDK